MLKYIMVTGTAYNTFFYILCWDTTGYVYIYIWSPPVSAPDLPCRAGGNDLLLHLQSFSARGQTHGNTVHICIYVYIYIYCN